MEDREYAYLAAGSVEYDRETAAVEIDTLLEMLQEMKDQGVTHVVQYSGNYRGAKYANLPTSWEWDEDYH